MLIFSLVQQSLLGEYSRWLHSSNTEEAHRYLDNFHNKWDSLIEQREMVWSDPRALVRSDEELSVKVLESFNAGSASRVFEKEIREVVGSPFKPGITLVKIIYFLDR